MRDILNSSSHTLVVLVVRPPAKFHVHAVADDGRARVLLRLPLVFMGFAVDLPRVNQSSLFGSNLVLI